MIKSYFKIAWRNVVKNKVSSAINILGLAIGIAACLLILQYVSFELSYENFHVNKDRIYRVQQDRYDGGKLSTQWAAGAFAIGNAAKDAIPEIEDYVKLSEFERVTASINGQALRVGKVFYASSSFFNIFTYPLLSGDKNTALKEPFTAALSEKTARKLFGSTDVVGKSLQLHRYRSFKITAVYKDAPVNTQLKPDMLLSYATLLSLRKAEGNDMETQWMWDGCLTYVLLNKSADAAAVERKIVPIVKKFTDDEFKATNAGVTYHLQPLKDIHLYSHYMGEPGETGDAKTVYLLIGIACVIVIIAWVNYINLATARAITRAKEVGVRKAIGSLRKQLIFQFLSESALLNCFALLVALFIVIAAIPGFNSLSGQQISYSLFGKFQFWIALGTLFIAGVFLSGLYPAFVLSNFKPIEVLKGNIGSTGQSSVLRKSLVVFQFAASLFLLIGTVTVYRQVRYMRQQSLGINIDQTLVITPPNIGIDSTYLDKMTALKQELSQNTAIKSLTLSTSVPGEAIDWNVGGIRIVGAAESTQKQYRLVRVDYDFMKAFGLKLIAGRAFSKEFGNDGHSVIFSRKGIEQLGFDKPQEAIGKKIDFWGDQCTIVGVAENFHQQSLRASYDPMFFQVVANVQGALSIKMGTANVADNINAVKTAWSKFFPGNVFEYFFLDDHFNDQYKADQRFGSVFGLFTSLAVLVACMGLFGLASFTTLQRTKEIGIRKVLGASVISILKLLYREFALLILVAFGIAIPIAWYFLTHWLQSYAFRININWISFVLPFIIITVIAVITVSFQSLKAAMANPVKCLKAE